MKDIGWLVMVAKILVLIGGLNWLFVGLFDVNIVTAIFGMTFGRLIFIVVGIAAVYLCYCLYEEKFKKTM